MQNQKIFSVIVVCWGLIMTGARIARADITLRLTSGGEGYQSVVTGASLRLSPTFNGMTTVSRGKDNFGLYSARLGIDINNNFGCFIGAESGAGQNNSRAFEAQGTYYGGKDGLAASVSLYARATAFYAARSAAGDQYMIEPSFQLKLMDRLAIIAQAGTYLYDQLAAGITPDMTARLPAASPAYRYSHPLPDLPSRVAGGTLIAWPFERLRLSLAWLSTDFVFTSASEDALIYGCLYAFNRWLALSFDYDTAGPRRYYSTALSLYW